MNLPQLRSRYEIAGRGHATPFVSAENIFKKDINQRSFFFALNYLWGEEKGAMGDELVVHTSAVQNNSKQPSVLRRKTKKKKKNKCTFGKVSKLQKTKKKIYKTTLSLSVLTK